MEPIKLLIIDDSQIHVEGLKLILKAEENFEIIGGAYTIPEAKRYLQSGKPEVVLLDISLEEESDGMEFARYLKKNFPDIKVIILSHYKKFDLIIKALQARVKAYIAKDIAPADLINTIYSVVRNDGVFLGKTLPYNDLLNTFGGDQNIKKGKPYELTEREVQIIELLAQGRSSKEIASTLSINTNTVETYKERIKTKLGVDNVISIVVFAINHSIIKIDKEA